MTIDLTQFHDAFFEESFEALDSMEAALLKLDAAGESGGAGTNNGNIKTLHWTLKQSFDSLVNGLERRR